MEIGKRKILFKMGRLMNQTPVHDAHNHDLLELIPLNSKKVIEIGCSSGALAREFKKRNNFVDWVGVEIDSTYAELAKRYCDKTLVLDIDVCVMDFYEQFADRDVWIFGDTLEHLKDPWSVLKLIRKTIPDNGSIVACIPNAQHWSLVIRMAIGDFRYEDSGLLDKTHLRWFSRQTIMELFTTSGYKVVEGVPRIFNEPNQEKFLPLIGEIAKACEIDPDLVIKDAIPLQYVIRAMPV